MELTKKIKFKPVSGNALCHAYLNAQSLLQNGQLLITIFLENMIDEEAFALLDEASLKKMIPVVGPRKKLMKQLEEEKVFQN